MCKSSESIRCSLKEAQLCPSQFRYREIGKIKDTMFQRLQTILGSSHVFIQLAHTIYIQNKQGTLIFSLNQKEHLRAASLPCVLHLHPHKIQIHKYCSLSPEVGNNYHYQKSIMAFIITDQYILLDLI